MNLDNNHTYLELDPQGIINHINRLPDQFLEGWSEGIKLISDCDRGIRNVLIVAGGLPGCAADLLAACVMPECRVPVVSHRQFTLPAWVGVDSLVILISHLENQVEIQEVFDQVVERNSCLLVISRHKELESQFRTVGAAWWITENDKDIYTSIGSYLGFLLAVFVRYRLISDLSNEILRVVESMREQQKRLLPEIDTAQNPAKRLAGQLVGRDILVIGSGYLDPVATYWKTQFNLITKTWAQSGALPELDYSTIASLENPHDFLEQKFALFLNVKNDLPRNSSRSDLTREIFMLEAIGTDCLYSRGDLPLANILQLLHFGDYTAYYLAIAYCVDPAPSGRSDDFERFLLHAD